VADPKSGIAAQLSQIFVLTDDMGKPLYTRTSTPARSFSSKAKKDFAYAAMFAYMRFLIWVRSAHDELLVEDKDAAMSSGSSR
jgi:hypothetical protein